MSVVPITKNRAVFERGDHVELGLRLLARFTNKTQPLPVHTEGEFYAYDSGNGTWGKLDRDAIAVKVHDFAGSLVQTPSGKVKPLLVRAGDVRGALEVMRTETAVPGFFDSPAPGILFQNGFVRVTEGGAVEREKVTPEHRCRHRYAFDHEPKAAPLVFLRFLESIYRDDEDALERIECDQEFFGACLLGVAPRFQRCMVKQNLHGDNGKSTLTTILRAVMPPGSTCSVPPQSWGTGQTGEYNRAMLAGKLFNAVTELPQQTLDDLETFKAMITGDRTIARPIFGAPFEFTPTAGHFFSANQLPASKDINEAFWRRIILMPLTRVFAAEERDPNIAAKVLVDTPKIVSWLIDGAARLMQRGHYRLPKSHVAALELWRTESDQVRQFAEDHLSPMKEGDRPSRSQLLFDAYTEWAARQRNGILSMKAFKQRMESIGYKQTRDALGYKWDVVYNKFKNVGSV